MGNSNPDGESTRTSVHRTDDSWMIGDYRVVRKIAEGGMGVVYEAEQQHPRRAVALKVIRGGRYVDAHLVKLFERETQALARLRHPSIAAIYETGRTEAGEHYFAMELVRGVPLLQFFTPGGALNEADTALRLRVFCRICEAVNYAHQRGVIHRDLKPANILISSPAASASGSGSAGRSLPEIKILDFGLARITDGDIAATTIVTEVGVIQGTLSYMSPEQARGNPDEIDLRTDVYSLGVILAEMLTGELPYELPRSSPQALRAICEAPARLRAASGPGQVKRRVDRDLETIVLKAVEKDPPRRYQSALALSEDIERYLARQPILARPPSTIYQFRKLLARHKAGFGAAAALLVMLAVFAIMMAVQSARIAQERDKAVAAERTATRVTAFLVDLFKVSDPTQATGNTITVREVLDRGAARIRRDLAGEPLVQAQMMDTVGNVYDSLGLYDASLGLVQPALDIRRRALGSQHADVAASLTTAGIVWWHKGDYQKARQLLEEARAIREKLFGPDDLIVAASLHDLGNLYFTSAEYDKAQAMLERSLAIREKLLDPDHPQIAGTINTLGAVAFRQGSMPRTRELWERTLAMRERTLGPEHPFVAQTLNNLAAMYTLSGDWEKARPLLERTVRIQEKVLGPRHPDLASGLNNLGDVLMWSRDYDGARGLYARAVDIREAAAPQDPELARLLCGLARANLESGDVAAARQLYGRALAIRERAFGKDHPENSRILSGLALCDMRDGRHDRAERGFRHAISLARASDGTYSAVAADLFSDYARLLRATNRAAEAAENEQLAASLRSGRPGSAKPSR